MASAPGKRRLSQASLEGHIIRKRAKVKINDEASIDTVGDAAAGGIGAADKGFSARKPTIRRANGDSKNGSANCNNGDDDDLEDEAKNITIQGPDLTLRPLSNLRDIIQDLLDSAKKGGLQHFVDCNEQFYIRVGTLCSGTDAPLHVSNLFGMLKNAKGDQVFTTINKFACEIEPFKQGFLRRNSKPELLFRDATDFAKPGAKKA